jgi:transcriptional regulator with GAF, ATPase, and Fis domain
LVEPFRKISSSDGLIVAQSPLTQLNSLRPFIVASSAMKEIIAAIELARDSLAPVLVTGETGTGKELISRAVHALSPRRAQPFIAFNCAEAGGDLFESRLFGHLRGSFTGATGDHKGIIRQACGGTLLLDEIGELSPEVQAKILRFLQEGEVLPVGADRPVKTDVRVIIATNRDLEADVSAGCFRADLFERLNVLRLRLPPLRERREEIPLLIEHFLERFQQQEHRCGLRLSDEAMELLLGYDWPRNVRELENEVHRLVVWAGNDEVIGPARLSEAIRAGADARSAPAASIIEGRIVIDLRLPYHRMKDELEKLAIINALEATGGNLTQAASRLGMSRFGFRKALGRYGTKVQRKEIRSSRE